jgi:plastocyanin
MRMLFLALMIFPVLALADDLEHKLTLRDHRFEPAEVRVPAGKKIKLVIDNQDNLAEEFDSHALNREKVIAPKSTGTVYIGPLSPGRYPFMGEFHSDTAKGVVISE